MNVLFVGKWDIAGAYIADRLVCEGHTLSWMTSEPELLLWNRQFKGNVYRGTWHREDYQRILKSNSIDTVIFLTAEYREQYEELPEYESLMLDFTNLLSVLRSYPLKCLVYLSSVELDYEEIHTPVLTDLAAGEMLCQAYHTAYGLPSLILRFGNVYGSSGLKRMGYTGQLLQHMTETGTLSSQYSPDSYVDLIYGEDLAMAVNLLLKLSKKGLYYVMTNHPLTMEEYIQLLGQSIGVRPAVTWGGIRTTAPREFFLSHDELRLETGWIPFYLLPEKGMEVLKKLQRTGPEEPNKTSSPVVFHRKLMNLLRRPAVTAFLETALLFGITCVLLPYSKDVSDLKYVDIRLMFVALVSCLHGARFGFAAIVLASLSYAFSLISSQIDISYLLYSVDTWIPFVVYTVAGASIGYLTDRRQDELDTMQENQTLLQEKYDFLKAIHGETLAIKGNLQRQIITEKHSFGHAYEVAVELDSLKPELILLKVISILEHIMDCRKAAVCLITNGNLHYARLKACSSALREHIPNSFHMDEFPKIYEAFDENRLFVNRELLPEYPDYAAPIYYKGELYAFACVYDVGVEKFTVYFQNLFKIITSLIEKNLVKALEYETLQHDARYYPDTELLYPNAFENHLNVMRSESGEIAYSYILAKVYPPSDIAHTEAAALIASVIRGSDCMGIDKDGDYAVIFVNMTREHLDLVKERFRRKGLDLEEDTRE